jgi:replication factor C large subunit
MSVVWTDKYSPKTLDDIVGNKQAKEGLVSWLSAWPTQSKWALIMGPQGVGKTMTVHVVAAQKKYDLLEVNRENIGHEMTVEKLAEAVSTTSSLLNLEDSRRLVLIDEVDVLTTTSAEMDRILDVLKKTKVPVVFTLSDQDALYASKKLYALRRAENCTQIKFDKVRRDMVQSLLKRICQQEGVRAEPEALAAIAENAGGDVRAAVNDLQAFCTGEEVLRATDVEQMAKRDIGVYAYKTVLDIISAPSIYTGRTALSASVADDETIFAWLIENLPSYSKPLDKIHECCNELAKASVYGYVANRFRLYELKKYMKDLICYAPQLLGDRPFKKLVFPTRLKYMSKSRQVRSQLNILAKELGRYMHASKNTVLEIDAVFLALMTRENNAFYSWFKHRFGDDAANTLMLLLKEE